MVSSFGLVLLRCLRPNTGLSTTSRAMASLASASRETPGNIDPAYVSNEKIDIEALFLNPAIRRLLNELAGLDLEKIYATRRKFLAPPRYELLTDAQLKDEMVLAVRKARKHMQMPPVLRKRKPLGQTIKVDPEIQGLHTSKFVFTDISFGHSDKERIVVVRQPDGILRTASWEERERMIQTYFTRPEKQFDTPRMFTEPHITNVLKRGWYSFLLNRACVQFEPDSTEYLGVTQRIYEYLMENGSTDDGFEQLRSTRHFGPMCFYFAVTNKGDALVLDMIKRGRIEDAAKYVQLLHMVHPEARSASRVSADSSPTDYIQAYIDLEAQKKPALQLALQTFKEMMQEEEPKAAQQSQ